MANKIDEAMEWAEWLLKQTTVPPGLAIPLLNALADGVQTPWASNVLAGDLESATTNHLRCLLELATEHHRASLAA